MKKLKLPEELFTLSKEQEELSMSIYGKPIKCLVAPYHSYGQIETALPFSITTWIFPEKHTDYQSQCSFINSLVSRDDKAELRVITTSMNIIGDMVDGCVRVLTERNEIVDCPIKTFAANIHSIRRYLLENEDFSKNKREKNNISHLFIDNLIKEIIVAETKGATDAEKYGFRKRISFIGEPVFEHRLNKMIESVPQPMKGLADKP